MWGILQFCREDAPGNMAELVAKYRLHADDLLVKDLIAERDFLAQRLGIPMHLLQVLSWGGGTSKCCVLGKCAHNCFSFVLAQFVYCVCMRRYIVVYLCVCLHVYIFMRIIRRMEGNAYSIAMCVYASPVCQTVTQPQGEGTVWSHEPGFHGIVWAAIMQ